MATSGSVDFNRTRNEIIDGALRLCGQTTPGETPGAAEVQDASEALNMMVKAWQAQGIHLWAQREATLFIEDGKYEYDLGPSGDHATDSFSETTLSSAAADTDGTVELADATIASDGDYIGIVLDSDTYHWTTVNGAPSGSTVTLTTAIDGAAASGNTVYVYTSKVDRPLKVIEARRRDSSDIDTPIQMSSRQEYFDLSNKASQAKTTQFYFEPRLTNGKLYIWPAPDGVSDVIKYSYYRPLEDFDSATNEPDFPQEWIEPIKYNLAVRLAPEYGLDMQQRQWLKMEANEYLAGALSWDAAEESVYFQIATDWNG